MYSFIIADNQDITRAGLRFIIGNIFNSSNIVVVENKKDLTSKLLENDKVIVILDYTNTDFNSTDEILNLSRRFGDAQWILFSYELSEPTIKELSLYNRFSMILKENSSDEIVSALKCATRGERYLCHQISSMLTKDVYQQNTTQQLTQTESEILRLIAHGKTVKEIAAMRNSSFHTIVTHKKNIFRKLEVNTVYEATKYALKAGLVDIVEYYI